MFTQSHFYFKTIDLGSGFIRRRGLGGGGGEGVRVREGSISSQSGSSCEQPFINSSVKFWLKRQNHMGSRNLFSLLSPLIFFFKMWDMVLSWIVLIVSCRSALFTYRSVHPISPLFVSTCTYFLQRYWIRQQINSFLRNHYFIGLMYF